MANSKSANLRNPNPRQPAAGNAKLLRQIKAAKWAMIIIVLFASVLIYLALNERGTALRLQNQTLPKETPADNRFTFGFNVLNYEGKVMLYTYAVLVDGVPTYSKKIVMDDRENRVIFATAQISEKGRHRVSVILTKASGSQLSASFEIQIT